MKRFISELRFNISIFITSEILKGHIKFEYIPKYFKEEVLELLIDSDTINLI